MEVCDTGVCEIAKGLASRSAAVESDRPAFAGAQLTAAASPKIEAIFIC